MDSICYSLDCNDLRFIFMSSGTHMRHLCIMGHPGDMSNFYWQCFCLLCMCTSLGCMFDEQVWSVLTAWTLRSCIGANIQPVDRSLQPDLAVVHCNIHILDSGSVVCGGCVVDVWIWKLNKWCETSVMVWLFDIPSISNQCSFRALSSNHPPTSHMH